MLFHRRGFCGFARLFVTFGGSGGIRTHASEETGASNPPLPPNVTNSRAKPQQTPSVEKHAHPPRVIYCAIYQTLVLDSQSFEFLICILLPANMPLIRCTNVFYKGDYPVTFLPPPRRLAPSLGQGTTWVRQLRSGSCHHPTAATKCNEQPSKATETPSVEKHAHPPRVVYCAIYLTLTLITKFRVSNLHITTR